MARAAAGLLLFRRKSDGIEVLLVHPGGPLWTKKDEGAWSIPKGEVGPAEAPLAAAIREFGEEIGVTPTGPFLPLAPVKQKGGKTAHEYLRIFLHENRMLACARFFHICWIRIPLGSLPRMDDVCDVQLHTASGGRLIRMASMLPPVLSPNSVPRS